MSFRSSPIKGLQPLHFQDSLNYSPVTPIIAPFISSAIPTAAILQESQRLNNLLYDKNLEISRLYEEINMLRKSFEEQVVIYKKTIEALEVQLSDKQKARSEQFEKIRERFDKLTVEQSESLKSIHSHQIQFLLKEIAQQKSSNETLQLKLTLQAQETAKLKESYQRQISSNANEINSLNHRLNKIEESKDKQIRDLNSKRQLQKSRTSGLISSRRQATNFMDRQVRKLNEELLQKTIQLQSINRELNRQKKKHEQTIRSYNNQINEIKHNYEEQIQLDRQESVRSQKLLRLQIKQAKQQIHSYIQQLDDIKLKISQRQKEILVVKENLEAKRDQVDMMKLAIQKMREEHAVEITNLMKDRRKSRSNIGSSRSIISLKESGVISDNHQSGQFQRSDQFNSSSARLQKNLHPIKQESPDRAEQKDYSRQLGQSHLNDQEQPIQTQLQRAAYHYESLIQQLKRNHDQQIQILKLGEKKLRTRLDQKEHELLDILTKFSPLVKIHTGQKSLEEDRKERIERHWKADVALLEVLLRKYRIKVFD